MTHYNENMDFEQAAEEIQKLYGSFGLTCAVSSPAGKVTKQFKDSDWPHVEFTLTYEKGSQTFSTPYSMGVGLFKIPARTPFWMNEDQQNMLYNIQQNPRGQWKNKKLWAETIAEVARQTKQGPEPAEVLAACCADGLEAQESAFEDWAGNFGYDADSRKAEKIYNQCREQYFNVIRLIGQENTERMAELSRML